MASAEQQIAALQWVAAFRGATDADEASDWMVVHELATFDVHTGSLVPTEKGIARAEQLLTDMRPVPSSRRAKRRRTNLLLAALVGATVWWVRRS